MEGFRKLTVADLRRETVDSVSVSFVVPEGERDVFDFVPGQLLTLRAKFDGYDVRRCFSICSGVNDGEMRVAVKRVEGGAFSNFANNDLKCGDSLQVLPPNGRFVALLDDLRAHTYVAFAGGSGITPILAIIKSVLEVEPLSRFTLVYGNRDSVSIMFREALEDLKNRFTARFSLLHVFSRELQDVDLMNGRIDAEKCGVILRSLVNIDEVDGIFLCGPVGMRAEVRRSLLDHGFDEEKVHIELFMAPLDGVAVQERRVRLASLNERRGEAAGSEVTVILDGTRTRLRLERSGESVLDAVHRLRPDVPYACKGGMCCTCRAHVVEGEVEMDNNYTLTPAELDQGFILTCQAHPVTDRVVLDYDAR